MSYLPLLLSVAQADVHSRRYLVSRERTRNNSKGYLLEPQKIKTSPVIRLLDYGLYKQKEKAGRIICLRY